MALEGKLWNWHLLIQIRGLPLCSAWDGDGVSAPQKGACTAQILELWEGEVLAG